MDIVAHTQDTHLGRWTLAEWRPAPGDESAWAIERIWSFEGIVAHPRERVMPVGLVEIIVQLDGRYHDVEEGGRVLTPVACVSGMQTRSFVIEAPAQRTSVLGIRLQPPGAWALFSRPVAELAGKSTNLDDVCGPVSRELAERCADAAKPADRVRAAARWAMRRIRDSTVLGRLDTGVRWAAGRIAATGGAVSIAALRTQTGTGAARFAARFREQIGLTPKRYARVHRFRTALSLLQRADAGLSSIALRAGYYDQSHMNAEFRAMADMTPREYLAATHYPESTNLAESA